MNKDILARNILILDYLRKLDRELPEKTRFIVLKGTFLLLSNMADISIRQMSDADLLIKPEDKDIFFEALSHLGFSNFLFSQSAWFIEKGKGPPIIIDLHFSLPVFETGALWKNAIPLDGKAMCIPLEYNFIHIITHALINHADFTEKEEKDLKLILENAKKTGNLSKLVKDILNISQKLKIGFLLYFAIRKIYGIEIGLFSAREKLIKPFLMIMLSKKHKVNEYILEIFYAPHFFIKRFFPEKNYLLRNYGKTTSIAYFRYFREKLYRFFSK